MPRHTPGRCLPATRPWRAALVLAILATLFVGPGHALAHAEVVSADPLPNASVVEAPERVEISFSEPIDAGNAAIELLDAQLRVVDGVGPVTVADDATAASVDLPPLQAGIYTVSYQVVSTVDGHATEGLFAFVIDPTGAQAPPTGQPVSSTPSIDGWAIGARWLGLIGALIGLGSLVTWWHAGGPTLARLAPGARRGPPWRLVVASAVATLIGLALYLTLSARPFGDPAPGGIPFDVASPFGWTPFAIAMRVAMVAALLAALIGAAAELTRGRSHAPYALVATGCLAISLAGMSAAGHASSLGGPMNAALDWLHLVAAAAWLGGLPAVYVLATRVRAAGGSRRAAAAEMLRRHGRLALVAGPLVVLTGLANSPLVLGPSRELVASPYGNLLLAKAVLVSIALGIGAANHLLLRGHGRGRLAVLVGSELVVAALAVMAAAAMVTIQPGAARQPIVTGPSVHPAHFFGEAGPSSIHLSVSVPAPGQQTYQVTVRDSTNGLPRPDVQKVFLTFAPPPTSDLPAERVELQPGEIGGLYTAGGAYTPVVGEWTLEVVVRRAGELDESASFGMDVVERSPPLAGPPPDVGVGVPAPLAALWDVLPGGVAGWIPGALTLAGFLAAGLMRPRSAALRGVLLASAAVLVLGAGSRSVVEAANEPTPTELAQFDDATTGSPEAGAPIYRANCASCHGPDGEGDGPVSLPPRPAPLAERVPTMSDAEVSYRIANGLAGTPMPAFASSLTEQERRDLVSYLRQRWGAP